MSKTKLHFFTIADYEEEERWLREQHKQGLRLVKLIPPCFYVFEECTPEDVVYRLDYKNGTPSGEYLQMFRDYGWEPCGSCVGWMYFRKPASEMEAENDAEIFSDDSSRVELIQHVMKTRMLPILAIFLLCVVPNWLNCLPGVGVTANLFFGIIFSVLMVLYVFLLLYCGRKLTLLHRKYKHT